MKSVLRKRAFRSLAAMYAAESLLGWFGSIALMVLVYAETQSTAAAAAMLLCKQVAPGVIVPMLGAALDTVSVGRALAVAFLAQAAALAALGLLGYGVMLFPLAIIAGTAGTLVRTMLRAGVARTLSGNDLREGNAFLNIIMGVSALAGPALAAFAVVGMGASEALVLTGVVMAGCALCVFGLPSTSSQPALPQDESEVASEPARRLATASGTPIPLGALLGVVAIVTCLFAMDEPALLAYSELSLSSGVAGYGAIFTAWGVGVTIGSLVFTRLLHLPMLRVYAAAVLLCGAAYIGLAVAPTIGVACAVAVIGGVGNGLEWVSVVTAIQEATPKGQEARAAARLEAIATAAPGIGILIGGIVAEVSTPRVSLLIPGLLTLALLFFGALALRLWASRRPAARPVFSSISGGSV